MDGWMVMDLSYQHLYVVCYPSFFQVFINSASPSMCFISYVSTSNFRDGFGNIYWHFFHLCPTLSISTWTPRPLCSIVFMPSTSNDYSAGSALPLYLHIAWLYACSPSCTPKNLPTQYRDRYHSVDILHSYGQISLCIYKFYQIWVKTNWSSHSNVCCLLFLNMLYKLTTGCRTWPTATTL